MRKIVISLLSVAVVMFTSCGKFVDGYEVSPNDPMSATPALVLTATQTSTFMVYSGNLARFASIFCQYGAGTELQFKPFGRYEIKEGDDVNEWQTAYTQAMGNAKKLIDIAGTTDPYYKGIGEIVLAMNLGVVTDMWGNVPYTQAFKGLDNLNPAYDSQQSVYQSIQTLLTDAVTNLSAASAGVHTPGADDLIFGGDITKWKITAHILRARYANHLNKRDASGSATAALAAIDDAVAAGMAGPASDCNANFGSSSNEWNQWYAFGQSRANYIHVGGTIADLMNNLNDPRRSQYFTADAAGNYSGTALGSYDVTTSNVGPYFASQASPAPMATYVEAKFIEAEAALRAGNTSRANTAHNDAVKAHILQVTGSSNAAYETAHASWGTGGNPNVTLQEIMTQKYIAMFTQIEGYTDWRRTNIPALVPNPIATLTGIPRRMITPQSERLYNSNAEVHSNLLEAVWWDQ